MGNIAGDSVHNRDMLLEMGVLPRIIETLNRYFPPLLPFPRRASAYSYSYHLFLKMCL